MIGIEIIKDVAQRHNLPIDYVRTPVRRSNPKLVKARIEVAKVLRQRGLSFGVIGRMLGVSRSAAHYYASDDYRTRKLAYMQRRQRGQQC